MNNKVMLALLVVLLLVAGGTAYYSYTLNQRLDSLGRDLAAYEAEQAGRIGGMSENVASLAAETGGRLEALGAQLEVVGQDLAILGNNVAEDETRLSSAEAEIEGISGNINELSGRLAAVETEFSADVFDASAIYRKVGPAAVRITDGQNVIGSGFIYDNEGHVVTAYHVIEEMTFIVVITKDGRFFNASLAGYSQPSDVAVLKLTASPNIEPAALGDSSRMEIGEPVIAIGSPFDVRDTLTAGVISQVNRFTSYGLDETAVPSLIQFDAPVNPGNSGGPLANSEGEVIGIVVARIIAGEGDGIYYAVASNKVKRVVEAIIASGSFPYPWLGVTGSDLTPDLARSRGLETTDGVYINGVDSGGPAQEAGLRSGDIISALDGVPMRDIGELTSYLGEKLSPGDEAVAEVQRGTERLELVITIGSR